MARILHLSDLHFSKMSWGLSQFFSKQWIGNFNHLFVRKKKFLPDALSYLKKFCIEENIGIVICTGDTSTTGTSQELAKAAHFFSTICGKTIDFFAVPGNHDHYTKKNYRKKKFYDYFPGVSHFSYSLKEHGVEACRLSEHWYYVGLDTVVATSWYSSQGVFLPSVEKNLKNLLKKLPNSPILLATHFPFFTCDKPRKKLQRAEALKAVIAEDPRIQIYLHGHTHRQCIADLRKEKLALVLDSGSVAYQPHSTFHVYDLKKESIAITVYKVTNKEFCPINHRRFFWETKGDTWAAKEEYFR